MQQFIDETNGTTDRVGPISTAQRLGESVRFGGSRENWDPESHRIEGLAVAECDCHHTLVFTAAVLIQIKFLKEHEGETRHIGQLYL
jgi:hypothetical protein